MDYDHSEALIRDVIGDLVYVEQIQTIVLTHSKKLSDRIWNVHVEENSKYLYFSNIDQSGPTIRSEKSLPDDLKRVKELAKWNEESRELALDRLRVATSYEAYL